MTKADNRPPTKSRTFEDELNSISSLLAKCCNEGNKLLCELAQIPPVCREGFLKEAAQILGEHYLRDLMNLRRTKDTSPNLAVIERFERALRETYSIFLSIPELDRIFLSLDPHEDLPTGLPAEDIPAAVSALLDGPGIPLQGGDWDAIFQRMIRKCSEHTGTRPVVAPAKPGRGRRPGDATRNTYPLRNFLWNLALVIRRHGGALTLNAKEQRGTWIDALNGLRPLFPEGFIPKVPPTRMIEEVQAKANKHPL